MYKFSDILTGETVAMNLFFRILRRENMKRSRRIVYSLAIFVATSAFGAASAQDIQHSDFLTDYSNLKKSADAAMDYEYLAPGAENMANYSAVMIDQPEIFIAPNSKYKGMKPDDMKVLARRVSYIDGPGACRHVHDC